MAISLGYSSSAGYSSSIGRPSALGRQLVSWWLLIV